jgi:hypothetical protein
MGKEQTNKRTRVFDHANRMEDIRAHDQKQAITFLSCCLRAIALVAFDTYSL